MKKIVIIGGGASGMVASIVAAQNKNNQVTILEQNSICCKKILQTGNGRCNYFNENQELSNYHSKANDYIEKIITKNNLKEVLSFFKNIGIIPKIKNGYYYPLSNQASSVKECLIKKAKEEGVIINVDTKVTDIKKSTDNSFNIITNKGNFIADEVVMAMGSFASIPDSKKHQGYHILEKFGHNIEVVLPSLVQLKGNESYFKQWSGVRSDVILTLKEDDKIVQKEVGEIQLTDYGISGICTFNISGRVSRGLNNHKKEIVEIDFLPSFSNSENELRDYLMERKNTVHGSVKSFLIGLLNDKLIDVILEKSSIDYNTLVDDLEESEFNSLVKNIKNFQLLITGTKSYDHAQVCSGGVALNEINPKTMESRICPHLYITGELLDLDGVCGGYNLTIAWISGLLAGSDLCD